MHVTLTVTGQPVYSYLSLNIAAYTNNLGNLLLCACLQACMLACTHVRVFLCACMCACLHVVVHVYAYGTVHAQEHKHTDALGE